MALLKVRVAMKLVVFVVRKQPLAVVAMVERGFVAVRVVCLTKVA